MRFVAQRGLTRVVFAAGARAELVRELDALGCSRALLLCSPRRGAEVGEAAQRLGARCIGTLATAVEHVPAEVAAEASARAAELNADAVIAIGGGSAIGLGKAVAVERPVRLIALPTTYSGSEMTSIYGITSGAEKRTARSDRVRPAVVIYDPELTLALPLQTSLTSLWNALAHAVEALWWPEADPIVLLAAEQGVRVIVQSMDALGNTAPALGGGAAGARDARSLSAREQALLGSYLAGVALGESGTALQHKLCHVLGGSFNLPHAATHAIVLPHVVRYNASAAPDAMDSLSRALAHDDPARALSELAVRIGTPTRLADVGFSPASIDAVIDKLLAAASFNPRPLERDGLRAMLLAATGP